MFVNILHIVGKLTSAERKKVKNRSAEIIAEEMSIRSRQLKRVQRLVRKHVKPGTSLVDQLLAERRHGDLPAVLRVIGEESKRKGTSVLSSRQIDRIIKAARAGKNQSKAKS